jgi:hypothetical protein
MSYGLTCFDLGATAIVNQHWIILIIIGLIFVAMTARAKAGENVDVRAGINHESFDRLLKKYVNEQGLVNYGAWKQSVADLSALDEYLRQFSAKADNAAHGNEKAASLVNAYNGFVLRWILSNYPAESIWQLKDSFPGKRNEIGGRKVALDDIEHGTLRPLIGYRTHSALVCAARSCPPLRRFAYTADNFDEQDDSAYRAWLAREDLNKFLPNENKVEISSIFKWFKQDFDKVGGVPRTLGRYAPHSVRIFAANGKYDTKYLPYGRNYGRAQFLFDNIFK